MNTKLNNKALTLIEVVSSLVLISIGLLAILGMFSFSSKIYRHNFQRAKANQLFKLKMEEVLIRRFKDDVTEAAFYYPNFPEYRIDVKQTVPYYSYEDLKKIDVTISWESHMGYPLKETVSTLVADYYKAI